MIKFANIKNALGYGRVFYIPNTNLPAAAELTISRIGDSFFFAKCLQPNIEATKSTVMMIACIFTLRAVIVPKQFPKIM